MYSIVLLASGTGSRMGKEIPKQFIELEGKPIIIHTLESFVHLPAITEIIIVSAIEQHAFLKEIIAAHLPFLNYKIVEGGDQRQDSTFQGILHSTNEYVLIHEAARPFVSPEEFQLLIDTSSEAITFGAPIPFTVLQGTDQVEGILDRSQLINVQLPQKFNKNLLLKAMTTAQAEKHYFTEEASLFKYYYQDIKISILKGKQENIKITYPMDLILATELIKTMKILED